MKHIVWKAYWDFEKEEKWLNEMSAKGMALSDYSWCRYVFKEEVNNKYIYRIQLLENKPNHPESIAYIRFLEENGIEYVASYWCWIFVRKEATEGPFDIFSDAQSRINHYKRIGALFGFIGGLNLVAFLMNIVNLFIMFLERDSKYLLDWTPLYFLNLIAAIGLIGLWGTYSI